MDWWKAERAAQMRGSLCIAGVDEAGRGPIAGPVIAAAVILPLNSELAGVRDSKQMTARQRAAALPRIYDAAVAVGIGSAEPAEIDNLNILRASHLAMRRAIADLAVTPDHALIDGLPVYPFPVPQTAIVGGDRRSISIAAASVVAKVTRDLLMAQADAQYPGYGFAQHKGYPTPAHLIALAGLGACPIHRRAFGPVARLESQPALELGHAARNWTGLAGESAAVAHITGLGWRVLHTRRMTPHGELDIVARCGNMLVFVEVKTRQGTRGESPAAAVNAVKRQRLAAAAQHYIDSTGVGEVDCRFDIAAVRIDERGLASVELISNAFEGG